MTTLKEKLLEAAVGHVAFDGWSNATFDAACKDADIEPIDAAAACPRGSLDLAVAYHMRGDASMVAKLAKTDLSDMRIREKIAFAIRARLELADKEAVRKGAALLALPQNAAEGATLIWGTADAVWSALDDPSRDGNWYSKRVILSGVHSSVILFWLGDDSDDHRDTWDFLDRRIENVMQIEAAKSQFRANPLTKGLMAGVDALMRRMSAPTPRDDLPGRTHANS